MVILVVGLTVIDFVTVCSQFPCEDTDEKGGNASNNCTILKQLGERCEFFGTLGEDWMGKLACQNLKDCGIAFEKCPIIKDCQTPVSTIILNAAKGTRTIRHYNPGFQELSAQTFKISIETSNYDWIHFEGRRKNLSEIIKMITFCNENKFANNLSTPLISVEIEKPSELNWPAFAVLDIDLYFIGKDYANYRGFTNMEQTLHALHQEYLTLNKNANVSPHFPKVFVNTWGSIGSASLIFTSIDAIYISCCAESHLIPSFKVVDSLGAGDTFLAAFIHSYLCLVKKSKNITDLASMVKICLRYSNYVAACKCSQKGLTNLHIPLPLTYFTENVD